MLEGIVVEMAFVFFKCVLNRLWPQQTRGAVAAETVSLRDDLVASPDRA